MFRLWGKIWKDARLVKHLTYEEAGDDTRTHKVFKAVDYLCSEFDLGKPIWLDLNIKQFQQRSRTRFGRDNFIEEIPFDYLEIQVIEEDP